MINATRLKLRVPHLSEFGFDILSNNGYVSYSLHPDLQLEAERCMDA